MVGEKVETLAWLTILIHECWLEHSLEIYLLTYA